MMHAVPHRSRRLNRLLPAGAGQKALDWWCAWAGVSLLAVWTALAIVLVLCRHASFHTNLFDLGYYTQALWNTAHGRWFASSLKPPTYFAGHFSPILVLLVPLFWLMPDARVLLVIEVIALGTAVVPAYLYLRSRRARLAPLIVLAFALNPMLHQVLQQEFHELMLAVPALAIALIGLQTGRQRLLVTGLILTLLVREDMGLYVASFGLYLVIFRPRQRLLGAILIVASVAWFLGIVRWVIPSFGGGTYRHFGQFADSADSIGEVLGSMARDPLTLLSRLMSSSTAKALAYVLLPLAGLPLLVPGEQLLWAPALFVMLISARPFTSSLQGWYVAPLIPLLWACVSQVISRLPRRWATAGVVLLLAAAAAGFRVWSPLPGGEQYDKALYAVTQHDRAGHRILEGIPADVSVAAQSGLGAHLADREQLYLFPWIDFAAPPQMILLDETSDVSYPLTPAQLGASIAQIQMDPEVKTTWEEDGYFVFQVDAEAVLPNQGPWYWSDQLRLEGYALAQADGAAAFHPAEGSLAKGNRVRVDLYWTAVAQMPSNYSVSVRLVSPGGQIMAQDDGWPGRGQMATADWPVGETIRDTHYLTLPPDLPGDALTLQVLVYETETLQSVPPAGGQILAELQLH
jgi:uncharacterized membrane protein